MTVPREGKECLGVDREVFGGTRLKTGAGAPFAVSRGGSKAASLGRKPYLFIKCVEDSRWVFIPSGGSQSHEDSQEWPPYERAVQKDDILLKWE